MNKFFLPLTVSCVFALTVQATTYHSDGSLGTPITGFPNTAAACAASAAASTNPGLGGAQWLHDNCAANDGDTITLPNGIFSWTTNLNVTKGITIQGQTTVEGTGPCASPPCNPVVTENTKILDDWPPPPAPATVRGQNVCMVKAVMDTSAKSFRLTGISFRPGTVTMSSGAGAATIVFTANTSNKKMRIDHCNISDMYINGAVKANGWCMGVADHNVFRRRTDIGGTTAFAFRMEKWNNELAGIGHYSWADYPYYGTDNFFFMETNSFFFGSGADTQYGARYVARFNYIFNENMGDHGTEGPNRGQRCKEIYNNQWYWPTGQRGVPVGCRGGSLLVYNNTSGGPGTSSNYGNMIGIATYRESTDKREIFDHVDGKNIFDANDNTGNNTYIPGDPPPPSHLFEHGQATAPSIETPGKATLTDSTKNWTTNQWKGYVVYKPPGTTYPWSSAVMSNDAHTITYNADGAALQKFLLWNTGEDYEIYRAVMIMDMAGGGGKSDLMSGIFPNTINTTTGTKSYGHPTIEPGYSWNNFTILPNSSTVVAGFGVPVFGIAKEGTHYFNLGTQAGINFPQLPQDVKDKYNSPHPDGSGKPLNGVPFNTSFTYPHPLVAGASPTPPPPTATAATNVAGTSFSANWNAIGGDTLGYVIDVATDIGFTAFVPGFNNLDVGNVTTKSVTGLAGSTPYFYRLRAYNGGGTGLSSNTITLTTLPSASPTPVPPVATAATNIATTSFTANWNIVTLNTTGYRIDVSTDNGFSTFVPGYNNLDVANVLTSNIVGLTSSTQYFYRVRAYNSSSVSGLDSNTINLTTSPTPTPSPSPQAPVIKRPLKIRRPF